MWSRRLLYLLALTAALMGQLAARDTGAALETLGRLYANGKDVVVIVPTMNADGERIDSYHAGDKLNLTFSGNVCHIFDKDGKNLEF